MEKSNYRQETTLENGRLETLFVCVCVCVCASVCVRVVVGHTMTDASLMNPNKKWHEMQHEKHTCAQTADTRIPKWTDVRTNRTQNPTWLTLTVRFQTNNTESETKSCCRD